MAFQWFDYERRMAFQWFDYERTGWLSNGLIMSVPEIKALESHPVLIIKPLESHTVSYASK
jgi:hypothetical protein